MAKQYKLVTGNVGNIYDLRRVGEKNTAVIDFSIATTERVRQDDGSWTDGETIWTNCTAWQRKAENIDKTWEVGDQVFVWGEVKANTYTNKDGEKVTREILTAELFGHEESVFPAAQDRPKNGNRENSRSSRSNNSGSSNNANASRSNNDEPRQASKKSEPAPAKKEESKSSSDDNDFNFDFDFGGDSPF